MKSTVGGGPGARLIAFWRRSVMFAGTTSAPRASPERTLSSASSTVLTRIGSIALNSSLAYLVASMRSLPSENWLADFGIWLTTATFGFVGPLFTPLLPHNQKQPPRRTTTHNNEQT